MKLEHPAAPKEPEHPTKRTGVEESDANIRLAISSLALIVLSLLFIGAITIGVQKFLEKTTPVGNAANALAPGRVVPPDPKIEVHPWNTVPELRKHEDEILNGYGADLGGHMHIPIDRAMDLVVSRLPIRPNAVAGLTTPGGLGREFSRGLADLPPEYKVNQGQGPTQIRGEVNKNVQK